MTSDGTPRAVDREPLACICEWADHDCNTEPEECLTETPYWRCPYLARWNNETGHDPQAQCAFDCHDEPKCVTCGPWDEEADDD